MGFWARATPPPRRHRRCAPPSTTCSGLDVAVTGGRGGLHASPGVDLVLAASCSPPAADAEGSSRAEIPVLHLPAMIHHVLAGASGAGTGSARREQPCHRRCKCTPTPARAGRRAIPGGELLRSEPHPASSVRMPYACAQKLCRSEVSRFERTIAFIGIAAAGRAGSSGRAGRRHAPPHHRGGGPPPHLGGPSERRSRRWPRRRVTG